MTNFNVTTKILVVESQDVTADTSTGSAKTISDYIDSIANTKTIRSIFAVPISNTMMSVVIIHDA